VESHLKLLQCKTSSGASLAVQIDQRAESAYFAANDGHHQEQTQVTCFCAAEVGAINKKSVCCKSKRLQFESCRAAKRSEK
jgi:hypothetical protein